MVMMKDSTPRTEKDNYNNINKNSYTSTSMRCPHCSGPLSKEMETSEWTVPPLLRDSFSMIGSAVGGTTSAFYGFNHGPSCDVFSSACAGLAGSAVPALAQLASSSYDAAISPSSLLPTASQDKNMRKSSTSSAL